VKKKCLFSFIFIICMLAYSKAYAHRVYFFAYAKGDKVVAEGYFIDGRKAINSHVEVFDKNSGEKLLEGKTNNRGQFSFTPPKKVDLKLTINAGMGHKAEFSLSTAQLGTTSTSAAVPSAQEQSSVKKTSTPAAAPSVQEQSSVKKTSTPAAASSINMAEFKRIIDASLDERLRPIIVGIEKSENGGVSVQSIVGGLGYIFGLMGIAMYFSGKSKS